MSAQLSHDVRLVLDQFRERGQSEFAWLHSWFLDVLLKHQIRADGFDPGFMAHLVYEGWFLFCCDVLTPKFHRQKMLLDVQGWEVESWFDQLTQPGSIRGIEPGPLAKQLRRIYSGDVGYSASIATDFAATLRQVNEFQQDKFGASWIELAMADAMIEFASEPIMVDGSPVRMLAWDLIDQSTGALVAADVGYQIGGAYASMTGFSDRQFPSLGIVQLLAQLELMRKVGIAVWDLGMPLPYKHSLGATEHTGTEWITQLHRERERSVALHANASLDSLPSLQLVHNRFARASE